MGSYMLFNKKKPMKTKMIKKSKQNYISGSQNTIFDKKEIIQKQQKLKKLYDNYKGSPQIEYFAKIKYQNLTYEVGQYIELYTLNAAQYYIARLKKVIRIFLKSNKYQAFIEAEWVLKKPDLPDHLLLQYGQYISAAQVFPSTEKLYLYVSSIKSKCTILCIEEYGQLGMTNESIFFTRSRYDQQSKILVPDPSTWGSDCDCNKPTNPDLKYVECSKCGRWFHSDCVQSKIINGIFLCDGCFSTNSRGMKEQ